MIRSSRTDALTRMRAADPVDTKELRAAIGEAELTRAMQRAIAAGEIPERPIPAGDRVAHERGAIDGGRARGGIFSRHRVASAGFGLACVAVIALLLVLGGGSVDSVKDGGRPAYAAAAVKVAEANPRLLITAPGWSIVHANSFGAEEGGLTYKHAGHPTVGPGHVAATMNWEPTSFYRGTLHEYGRDATARRSGSSTSPIAETPPRSHPHPPGDSAVRKAAASHRRAEGR